jgi:transposase
MNSPPPKQRLRLQDLDPEIQAKILEMHPAASIRRISAALGISRTMVEQVLEQAGRKKKDPSSKSGKLDEFQEALAERVGKGLTATRILREITKLGYQGKRTILAAEVSRLRAHAPLVRRRQVKRRFETPMGLESQVDWSSGTVLIAGKPTKINVLGIVLGHCRKLFYGIYRHERLSILLEGLSTGFQYFVGVTMRCVFDNMSTVVLGKVGRDHQPIWNPRFLEFSRHYGFEAFLCAVRDPDRKGKKEKAFRLVFDDFLKGSEFHSWADMQQRLAHWLDHTPGVGNLRKHGTTGLVPNEAFLAEQKLLIRLPEHRFPIYDEEPRTVDQDSTLSVRGVRYTVPSVLACRQAVVRLYAEHFEVFDHRGTLHESRKYLDPALHPEKLVIDRTHYAGLACRSREGDGRRLDQAFIKRFPSLEPLVDGLKRAMKGIAIIHLRHLLRLAERYGLEAFLKAATKAQEFRRFDAHAVRRILEREYPLPEEDVSAPSDGKAALIVAEVEEDDLDAFAYLDKIPCSRKDSDE